MRLLLHFFLGQTRLIALRVKLVVMPAETFMSMLHGQREKGYVIGQAKKRLISPGTHEITQFIRI